MAGHLRDEDGVAGLCEELRQSLNEDPRRPTVYRDGRETRVSVHCFHPASTAPLVISNQRSVISSGKRKNAAPTMGNCEPATGNPHFVGRAQELARLREVFERAPRGERQISFSLASLGSGRPALVDRFLDQILQEAGDWRLETSPPFSSQAPGLQVSSPTGRIGLRAVC